MKKNLMFTGFYSLLSAMLLLLGSCNQASFDDPRSSYDGSRGGHPGILRSPHPVRFSLEAAFDSGMDEPQQSGRFLQFDGSTKDTLTESRIDAWINATYDQPGEREYWNVGEYGLVSDLDFSENAHVNPRYQQNYMRPQVRPTGATSGRYPLLFGKVGYTAAKDKDSNDATYFGSEQQLAKRKVDIWAGSANEQKVLATTPGFSTHMFIYGYDASLDTYRLEGYGKLSWGAKLAEQMAETNTSGGSEIDHTRWTTRMRVYSRRTLLKAEQVIDVHKASYNSDRSEMQISDTEFISLEKGKKYRILAINDDGGFDPKRASLSDYPEAAAPMFYFAKGGNSPLPAATAFKKEGSDFPNNSGIVAYGMELDYTPEEDNFVHFTRGEKAEFYPLSPLLKLTLRNVIQYDELLPDPSSQDYQQVKDWEERFAAVSKSSYVLASSCLTQHFAYTISGVDEVGAKPGFKTILKTLQAEAYNWTGSPLEGTTYEPLLIPYFLTPHTIYLPLEARYRSLSSRQEQAAFVVPQTGEQIQGSLLADEDLYFRFYVRQRDSEDLEQPVKLSFLVSGGQFYHYIMGIWKTSVRSAQLVSSQRFGFNLALAKGEAVRDQVQAIETFWRNDRNKHRYNMNSLTVSYVKNGGVANQL